MYLSDRSLSLYCKWILFPEFHSNYLYRYTVFDWDFADRIEEGELTDDSLYINSVNIGYGFPANIVDIYFEGEWANYNKRGMGFT